MEEHSYREQDIARLPAFLSAAVYKLAHTLLARAGKCLFVPIRSMQYTAVLDEEEFIFVASQNKFWTARTPRGRISHRCARYRPPPPSSGGCR